ncbi:MAG: hypothetical protein AB7H90_10995 [Alphaproteobacteria bacterium]
MVFDTLAYAKHLKASGFTRQQAEAQAEAPNRFVLPDLATKADLRAEIAGLEQRLLTAMQQMEARLDARIETRIHQTELRMIGVMAAMLGLLFALLKFTP